MKCATDVSSSVKVCTGENKSIPEMQDMSLCSGKIGGNPDLIAWEVTEKLHTLAVACRK
jgi:hypothetical protein